MMDYLEELERFKDIKEIADLYDDVKKLIIMGNMTRCSSTFNL